MGRPGAVGADTHRTGARVADAVGDAGDAGAVAAAIVALADGWRAGRSDRLRRTRLDPADVAAVVATGYPSLIVPRAHGGRWDGLATVRHLAVALGALARVDPSLALVLSMHPAVLAYWVGAPEAPDPYVARWADQRARFFDSALAGDLWGTVTSEPGSGGDIFRTRTVAVPDTGPTGTLPATPDGADGTRTEPLRYRLHGHKHFGSGFGVLPRMMTTALVPGEDGQPVPDVFVLDLRERPEGSALTVTRPWDGSGMSATQSDAVALDGAPAERAAWPFGPLTAVPFAGAVMLPLWVAIVAAVVDEAVAELRSRLAGRRLSMRPFEAAEWVRIDLEHFQLRRLLEGCFTPSVDGRPGDPALVERPGVEAVALDALRAKLAAAELAESIVSRVARVAGGGSYSASSPFAAWYEDVRALGFLRPPWALGYDQLLAATLPDDEPG